MVANIVMLVVAIVGAVVFLVTPWPLWLVGAVIFILGWLVSLVFIIPGKSAASRGAWAFIALGGLVIGLFSTLVTLYYQAVVGFDTSLGLNSRLWAIFIGAIAGGVVTLLLFFLVGYFSSIYVLALHEEGMSMWTAFKSYVFLIFNITLAWLEVDNGEIREIRHKGYDNKWLSRGKIIVKPGSAIVTEKAGKITGIRGAGITFVTKNERIREAFNLRPQFSVLTVENVLTADQIPLTIKLGVGHRITPYQAEQPGQSNNGNINWEKASKEIIGEKQYGLLAVSQETLLKATYNGGSSSFWRGFGGGAPVNILRDLIMTYTLADLFKLTGDPEKPDDLEFRINHRLIGKIESIIQEKVNGFANKNFGMTITVVDIREIMLPDGLNEAIQLRIRAMAEAEAIQRIESQRNHARGEMVTSILNSISTGTGERIGDIELQLATVFAQISRRALTDDILGHQYIEMLRKLAEGEGTKIFTTPNMPLEMKDVL